MRGNDIKVLVRIPTRPVFQKWSNNIKFLCKKESTIYTECILLSANKDLNKNDCREEYNLLYNCIIK